MWPHLIWPFEFSRKNFIVRLFHILLLLCILCTTKTNGAVVAKKALKAWECLRSGVRPLPLTFAFFLISSYRSHAYTSQGTTMHPHHPAFGPPGS